MMSRKVYLIHSPRVEQQLERITRHPLVLNAGIQLSTVKLADLNAIQTHDSLNHALVWVEQRDYPALLALARQKRLSLGFLPIDGDRPCQFFKNLDLPGDFDACLAIALDDQPLFIDLIVCNDVIVTNGVNLENQTTMAEFIGDSREYRGFGKLIFTSKRFLHAFSLTPHPVTLSTAKGKTVTTALTGMVLLDFHGSGALTQLFRETVSLRDRRISVALFAPQSVLAYLQLSSASLLAMRNDRLPQQVGYIRTETLTIQSPFDTHYLVNDEVLTTRELCITTLGEGIRVNAGAEFRERQSYGDDKENVSCDQLPQQEERIRYLGKTLPFFTHALEADFKDLFLTLKENASTSNSFVLLMVLSALLASLGLFLNSPSVVIGAMVLAPLMAPIISLAMGLLRSDADLSRRSFATLSIGMSIAILLSAAMAAVMPFHELTAEIEGRLHPSTLDLLVAVISGVAGAFAHARENIAKSLPGVAIAVALVPPLCVSGIGAGWQQWPVFYGAMLLFLTNLTGIILAAGLTFMVIGFAPFSRAKKGIMLALLLVAAVSVPLSLSFVNMQKVARIKQQLVSYEYQLSGQHQRLRNIKVRLGEPFRISADLVTAQIPDPAMLTLFEQHLAEQLGHAVSVDFSVRLVSEDYFLPDRPEQ